MRSPKWSIDIEKLLVAKLSLGILQWLAVGRKDLENVTERRTTDSLDKTKILYDSVKQIRKYINGGAWLIVLNASVKQDKICFMCFYNRISIASGKYWSLLWHNNNFSLFYVFSPKANVLINLVYIFPVPYFRLKTLKIHKILVFVSLKFFIFV